MNSTPSQSTALAIAASQFPGIARKTLHKLRPQLLSARDARDVQDAVRSYAERGPIRSSISFENAWDEARRYADFALETCESIGACVISSLDQSLFPACLEKIPDPPFFITYQGSRELVQRGGPLDRWFGVAVIGTRNATEEGIKVTQWLVDQLGNHCLQSVIVSGLAEGIDIAGHRAALSRGLRTVALMGKDLRFVYPAKHRSDAADIASAGGALVSEYLPQDPPFAAPSQFVERDRLQSAFSRAIIAMQCGRESGTMHAMRAAVDQGRDIYAFRFKTNPHLSEGSEALIAGNAMAGKAGHAKPVSKRAFGISSANEVRALAEKLGQAPASGAGSQAASLKTSQQQSLL